MVIDPFGLNAFDALQVMNGMFPQPLFDGSEIRVLTRVNDAMRMRMNTSEYEWITERQPNMRRNYSEHL
ncbi:hypothetical protein AMS66_02680 [Paenibacillus xylanivorans]|uniref:Uncharacterized protein n=1 Tax=Paenibacillus xylanivorans TaxID=1705561 RepID=A0A0N0C610_9BACL|nr:hypothetical protein AMS66_02680 [Paenibacillus xylanivorans]